MSKIFVGLSGGVDSAVSAALLKEQGHDVTGVFIKIWSPEFLECTWREDRLDAKRVAVHVGIPFKEVDLSEVYRATVVQDMIEHYKKGITPNPDVLCNRTIKFGAFAKWAFESGADTIATGHYARIEKREVGYSLLKGTDPAKDQSYFLHRLAHEDLVHIVFPIGALTKQDVRAKARSLELPNADKPDSQGLCFVGDVSMREFLVRFIPLKKGELIDVRGTTVGEHEGAALYTIGQRHGFILDQNAAGPYYVTRIDTKQNIVFVSKDKDDTLVNSSLLHDMHWLKQVELPVETDVIPRYRAKTARAEITATSVFMHEPQRMTPGQSLVFYDGEECLGGAVIG